MSVSKLVNEFKKLVKKVVKVPAKKAPTKKRKTTKKTPTKKKTTKKTPTKRKTTKKTQTKKKTTKKTQTKKKTTKKTQTKKRNIKRKTPTKRKTTKRKTIKRTKKGGGDPIPLFGYISKSYIKEHKPIKNLNQKGYIYKFSNLDALVSYIRDISCRTFTSSVTKDLCYQEKMNKVFILDNIASSYNYAERYIKELVEIELKKCLSSGITIEQKKIAAKVLETITGNSKDLEHISGRIKLFEHLPKRHQESV